MKYAITGGAGFIGSHLVKELVNRGEEVIVIDDFSTGKKDCLQEVLDKIKLVKGDIRDFELLKKSLKEVDFVLHHAALISVTESVEKPELYREVIFEGTRNVLEASRINKVKKVVFASSCAVYGNIDHLPHKEYMKPKPSSPYALFKLEGEKLCEKYYNKYGLKTYILRYFNVFGPGQHPDSSYAGVIPLFIKKVLNNQKPLIYGDGNQTRDFIFVKDVVNANLLACNQEKESGFGEPINLGSGKETGVNQILELINKNLRKEIKPEFAPERKGELRRSCSDNSKAKKMLGFKNKYSFEQGLKNTIEWVKLEQRD